MEKKSVEFAGLYVHIPFCLKKCRYCDFYSITDISQIPDFISALSAEINMRAETALPCDTIYIGGGTPSVLECSHIHKILDVIHHCFTIQRDSEVTLEVNPGTVSNRSLTAYRNAGINRISIGVQSFQDSNLSLLGRIHSASQACETIAAARKAGFDNLGIDLIYGLPGQSCESWLQDLTRALAFEPEHLSCYMLTYEPGTPMTLEKEKGHLKPLSENVSADLFDLTAAVLKSRGYLHYEVSNFAGSENRVSRHNRKYWTVCPYIGFGPSAHSFLPDQRQWNHRSVTEYISDINAGKPPVADMECLTAEQGMIESVYLGLRQSSGIDIAAFEKRYQTGFNETFGKPVILLRKDGYLEIAGGRCFLTLKGMLYLDSIAALLVGQL